MLTRTLGALAIAVAMLAPAFANDFTQPARDPKFIQSARRKDKELVHFYGRLIPGGTSFNHLGSFQVVVHRAGQDRPVTLVPVSSLAYAGADALQSAARTGDVVVGALNINYGMHDPEIMPGTLLLVYDGLRVHLRNVHGEDLSSFEATLAPVPAGQKLTKVEGAINEGSSSVASIGKDNVLGIYLQLTGGAKTPLRQANADKVLLTFKIPGLVDDDNSAPVQLVKPEEPKKGSKPAKQ